MTGRRLLPVRLSPSVLTGDLLPRPRVGAIGTYGLGFTRADEHTDPDDPTLTTVPVSVRPTRQPQPYRCRSMSGQVHGWPRWSSVLHGDGWAAGWTDYRPPPDSDADTPVDLRGHLSSEFGALASGWVRGVIHRLWTVHSRRDVPVDPDQPSTWPPAWGSTTLTAVDQLPMAAHSDEWPELPPGVSYNGVLAELDLDALTDGRTGGPRSAG